MSVSNSRKDRSHCRIFLRTISYRAMAPAADTFKDPISPCMGSATRQSQRSRTTGRNPFSSFPSKSAISCCGPSLYKVWGASGANPTSQYPAARIRSSDRARLLTWQIGRYAVAPAAVFSTAAERPAARRWGSTTPPTPAPSAVRSRAPRLRGSRIPSRTRRRLACLSKMSDKGV